MGEITVSFELKQLIDTDLPNSLRALQLALSSAYFKQDSDVKYNETASKQINQVTCDTLKASYLALEEFAKVLVAIEYNKGPSQEVPDLRWEVQKDVSKNVGTWLEEMDKLITSINEAKYLERRGDMVKKVKESPEVEDYKMQVEFLDVGQLRRCEFVLKQISCKYRILLDRLIKDLENVRSAKKDSKVHMYM